MRKSFNKDKNIFPLRRSKIKSFAFKNADQVIAAEMIHEIDPK